MLFNHKIHFCWPVNKCVVTLALMPGSVVLLANIFTFN